MEADRAKSIGTKSEATSTSHITSLSLIKKNIAETSSIIKYYTMTSYSAARTKKAPSPWRNFLEGLLVPCGGLTHFVSTPFVVDEEDTESCCEVNPNEPGMIETLPTEEESVSIEDKPSMEETSQTPRTQPSPSRHNNNFACSPLAMFACHGDGAAKNVLNEDDDSSDHHQRRTVLLSEMSQHAAPLVAQLNKQDSDTTPKKDRKKAHPIYIEQHLHYRNYMTTGREHHMDWVEQFRRSHSDCILYPYPAQVNE